METNPLIDPLARRLRENPVPAFLLGALALTLLRYVVSNPADLSVLHNEEASIYLHAAEKSFLDFFLMPDSNYINFLSKFCAFFSLRVLKAFDDFALVQNVVNWFAAACFSMLFLTRRFARLVPSVGLRLALCAYLYLLPIYDMYMVFSQGYYIFFGLLYYLLLLSDEEPPSGAEVLLVVVLSPFVVFGKPVFFVFGFAFLGLLCIQAHDWARDRASARSMSGDGPPARLWLLVYLLALYAFQAWFTFRHSSYIAEHATRTIRVPGGLLANALFYLQKGFVFLGYGLVCPFAHAAPASFARALCVAAGGLVAALFVVNVRGALRRQDRLRLVLLGLLAAGSALCVYGALAVDFLYQRFFAQDIFAFQWSQRMIFPVILFALFNAAFFLQDLRPAATRGCIAYLVLLCLASCAVPAWSTWDTGYRPSFTWAQTRPLLDARYPFIPHAYGIEFYYTRGLTFVSAETPLAPEGPDTLLASALPPGHRVMYVMLRQTPGVDAIALPPSATLDVEVRGVEHRAALVNPGMNDQYLFKFPSFVSSEALSRIVLKAPGLDLDGKTLFCHLIGF